MNNYCTNCGTRLGKKDFACKNCGAPIIDLPIGYKFKSNAQKQKQKKILTTLIIIILVCGVISGGKVIFTEIRISNLKDDYVIPYIKANYPVNNATIEFKEAGKCVVSGNCYFNTLSGCDGSSCEPYKYLNRFKCKSYYYNATINGEKFTITVFKKDGEFGVVEGKNIYGLDRKLSEDELSIADIEDTYVVPYVSEKYSEEPTSIKFSETGKCIIKGNCTFDRGGCDGTSCVPYEYLNKSECRSYYFEVVINDVKHTITAYYKDGVYNVVEGKNIYGEDENKEIEQ